MTLLTAGRTVAFSSVTVGASIAMLTVFPLGFLRSMGIAGGLVGPLAGLISLTLLPPFLLLGRAGERLTCHAGRAAEQTARGEHGGWYRLAHWLMRRPVPVAVAASAVLLVAAIPALSTRFTGIDASVLPPNVSSRAVDIAVQRDFPLRSPHPATW